MIKNLLVAGVAVALGVIAGELIDTKLGPMIEGADKSRTTVRRGVKIGLQVVISLLLVGVGSSVV